MVDSMQGIFIRSLLKKRMYFFIICKMNVLNFDDLKTMVYMM